MTACNTLAKPSGTSANFAISYLNGFSKIALRYFSVFHAGQKCETSHVSWTRVEAPLGQTRRCPKEARRFPAHHRPSKVCDRHMFKDAQTCLKSNECPPIVTTKYNNMLSRRQGQTLKKRLMRLTLVFPRDEAEQQIGEDIDKHSEDRSTMRHREVHHDEMSITGKYGR